MYIYIRPSYDRNSIRNSVLEPKKIKQVYVLKMLWGLRGVLYMNPIDKCAPG